jgi:putative iron-dependent peroxidase
VIDADGRQPQILRANIPLGQVGRVEFGTYLSASPLPSPSPSRCWSNMFIGRPAGSYDRILDFSTAVTGGPGRGR